MTAREPYAGMTAKDAKRLAFIVSDIYEHPKWKPYYKKKCVLMLLAIFADLERTPDTLCPTYKKNVSRLAKLAHVRYEFAKEFFFWLLGIGYLFKADCPKSTNRLVFWWHDMEYSQEGGEDGQE